MDIARAALRACGACVHTSALLKGQQSVTLLLCPAVMVALQLHAMMRALCCCYVCLCLACMVGWTNSCAAVMLAVMSVFGLYGRVD